GRDLMRAPVVVAHDHAFLLTTDGLTILDVSDPHRPSAIAAFTLPRMARELALLGSVAYVGPAEDGRVFALDVSDPSAPRQLSSFTVQGVGHHLAGAEPWLYLASLSELN